MNIKIAICLSFLSSLYFINEIQKNSKSNIISINAYILQWFHDWICFIFFDLFIQSIYSKSIINLIFLNILHSIIMIQFCYYKRCIITLIYNWMLDLPMCNRYIPIWQRCFNIIHDIHGICILDEFRMTYIWLNNQIIQSSIVLFSNIYNLKFYIY